MYEGNFFLTKQAGKRRPLLLPITPPCKILDPHHLHNFWGASPSLDLQAVASAARDAVGSSCDARDEAEPGDRPFAAFLIGAGDPRHVITTLARSRRHGGECKLMSFHIFESTMPEIARHVLLLAVLMTDDSPPTERCERFLEILMNARVRVSTAEYIERIAERLNRVACAVFAGEIGTVLDDPFSQIFDLSFLKFRERDDLLDVFHSWSRQGEPSKRHDEFDMERAWERRCRRFYGERYDHRKNMVDWDYNTRLVQEGASVIHFSHFAQWRLTGIGFPVRESIYPEMNRTLVTRSCGITKEYIDRNMQDHGCSVQSKGYWGDLLSGPYFSFGIEAEEPELFRVSNKQHVKNAVQVSEYNVAACIFEMRTGVPWKVVMGRRPGMGQDDAMYDADIINAWGSEDECFPPVPPGCCSQATENGENDENGGAPRKQLLWRDRSRSYAEYWKRLRVILTGPGDLEKVLTSRAIKLNNGGFDCITVGAWHALKLLPELGPTARRWKGPGTTPGILIVEGAKYLVFMDKKTVANFTTKIGELATRAGFRPVPAKVPEKDANWTTTKPLKDFGTSAETSTPVEPGILCGVDDVHRVFVAI